MLSLFLASLENEYQLHLGLHLQEMGSQWTLSLQGDEGLEELLVGGIVAEEDIKESWEGNMMVLWKMLGVRQVFSEDVFKNLYSWNKVWIISNFSAFHIKKKPEYCASEILVPFCYSTPCRWTNLGISQKFQRVHCSSREFLVKFCQWEQKQRVLSL